MQIGLDVPECIFALTELANQGGGPKELDRMLRSFMERFTEPAEGQTDGQETTATVGRLIVSDCAEGAWRQQDDQSVFA